MKHKGSVNYTRKELKVIKETLKSNSLREKPFSIKRLSTATSRVLNRPQIGIYYKMLGMSPKRRKRTAVPTSTSRSVTFTKPTKIEISEAGMTFYF